MSPFPPDLPIQEATASQADKDRFSTFGPKWDLFFTWADRHRIRDDALILIDVTLTRNRPEIVGSLLKAISSPTAKFLFSSWTDRSEHAESLSRIAEAVSWDPSILDQIRPLGYASPAKTYFKGAIKPNYLAALCVARPPVSSSRVQPTTVVWFETLRAWALVHALSCYLEKGIRLEENLHLVCTRLRIGSDHDEIRWLDALVHLSRSPGACRNLPQFDADLVHCVETVTRRQQELALDKGQVELLDALKAVASHLRYELKLDAGGTPLPENLRVHAPLPVRSATEPFVLPGIDEEGSTPSAVLIQGLSEDENVARLPVKHVSLTHQGLADRFTLVASAEQINFLPWSWNVPLEHERPALTALSTRLLRSAVRHERLLGVALDMAMRTGRSLRRALDIGIAESAGPEWTWISKRGSLERLSSRRLSRWSPKTDKERRWIRPEQPTQSMSVDPEVQAVLVELSGDAPSAHCLGDLWAVFGKSSPAAAFFQAGKESCPRVTPGMLGQMLSVSLLRITKDATFARLGSAHPRSALPGACAYATWSSSQIAEAISKVLPSVGAVSSAFPIEDSAMGSLLAVVEDRLPVQFQDAASRTNARRAMLTEDKEQGASALARFHNAYAGYLVTLLLAATGARPVKDPFESFFDFDFQNAFVFVDDKSHGIESNGRLIPIPHSLACQIAGDYVAHLKRLAAMLATVAPHLSSTISGLANGQVASSIPFFFFLNVSEYGIEWTTISEAKLTTLELFDWPLPMNLFRHRLATRLRESGLDAEIIDGLLGHSESGAESYGDGSWRTWSSDMKVASPMLERLFATLDAPYPQGLPDGLVPLSGPIMKETAETPNTTAYGRAGRLARRREWLRDAKSDARKQLKLLLAGQSLSQLSTESLDEIGKKLLFTNKGMPHRRGWILYGHFLRVLERHGQLTGKRARPTHYYARLNTLSPFNDLAPRALAGLATIQSRLETAQAGSPPRSFIQSALYGTLLLATESRVADPALLNDVLRGDHYRVIRLEGRYHLDHATDLRADDPDAAVRRIRISPRAAACLANALARKTAPRSGPQPIPAHLRDLADAAAPFATAAITDCTALLTAITAVVDQANVMAFPGVIAGLLAGRNDSWALSLRDQTRLLKGYPSEFPDPEQTTESESQGQAITIARMTAGEEAAIAAARSFLREYRSTLRAHGTDDEPDEPDEPESTGDTSAKRPSRRDLRRTLVRLIAEHSGRVSPTILLVAMWATTHVTRKRKGRFVALSSIRRYLGALVPALVELASTVDLRSLDEEALTRLYGQLLATGSHERPDYRYERLRTFQRWCETHHDVVVPDWSELPCFSGAHPANAGIILEEEYQRALSRLIDASSPERRESLAPALLLLFCYRFALRSKEATGLRRDEWLDIGKLKLVIVQSNNIRRNKTPDGSRRVVPLLFELSAQEKDLLHRWFGGLEAIAGNKRGVPIFCDDSGHVLDHDRICEPARQALKWSTGNPNTVLHHARHTAGSVVAMALADLELPGAERLSVKITVAARRTIQSLLLGFPGVSRRSPWAVARYLGHTGIDRARITYLHFLWDWAESLIWPADEAGVTDQAIREIWNLDELPRQTVADIESAPTRSCRYAPSCVDALKFLRLLARGYQWHEAADRLSIPLFLAGEWIDIVDSADRRLHLQGEPLPPDDKCSARFLKHIGENAWDRLIAFAHQQSVHAISTDQNQLGVGKTMIRREDILKMIGASRQWLMWADDQFWLTRGMLDYWRVGKEQRLFVGTDKAIGENTFKPIAEVVGITISSPVMEHRKKKFQIDVAVDCRDDYQGNAVIQKRCAFIILEGTKGIVRNSFEWLTAALAWSLVTDFPGDKPTQLTKTKTIDQLEQQLAELKKELKQARLNRL